MLATFLIAFHTRRIDNLTQTVRFLERFHPEVVSQSELILLCQDRCGFVDNGFAKSRTESMQLPCMQKSKMLNHGARIAQSDKIVVLDSDRILPAGYFCDVLYSLEPLTAITTKTMRRLLIAHSDQDILDGEYKFQVEERSTSNHPYMRNLFAGNVALHKADYWAAGGMDEAYEGYGFEDSDMAQRLIRRKVQGVFRPEIELHLYHESQTYGEGDQKRMFLSNGVRYCKNWNLPVPPPLQKEIDDYMRRFV